MHAWPKVGCAETSESGTFLLCRLLFVKNKRDGALELVRAALGHEVDPDTAGLLPDVVAAGGELHLLEGIEIVVGRRRSDGGTDR